MPVADAQAFAFLAARQSYPMKAMTGATPARAELDPILTAALRVPDHGKLEPWRLIVLTRPDMARLADLAEARAREMGGDAEKIAKGRGQYDNGHLAVVVISAPVAAEKVPLAEQRLSAGALCMNLVNAATAAGWGAAWLTGWPAHDATFTARAFGCSGEETVAGIVHIGGRGPVAPDRPRPDLGRVVRWGLE
ncbi:nitroreductase family protein [Tabrizicola fusiformis]|uniref:nitroreductase family protein n=1 Tax=Tabrizicola sp. SY72 TaxID=2741673 RepID=UPI0015745BD7|nr:nitroreductase family protein [Tabrizicola sp. SY72]NTT84782.1 nitroreductase family protein [Tabrizicola sp. SY72]